jgi:hypothetical protein
MNNIYLTEPVSTCTAKKLLTHRSIFRQNVRYRMRVTIILSH